MLYWTDIPAGRLFRLDPAGGTSECFYDGGVVGGFTLQADGRLLLFGANEVRLLDPDGGGERVLIEGIDDDMERFNDVIADPAGRVFAGTFGRGRETGGLYRLDGDGSIRCLWKGTRVSNGMAFTPDGGGFYWTDSTARTIFRFDYDRRGGELSNRRTFLALPAEEKTPDGMTVDEGGNVWSARWDGGALFRYDADGVEIERIAFPVAKVSSVVFGGAGLDELYVTTAGGEPGAETADGTLYRLRAGARGRAEFRSRIAPPAGGKNRS